MKKCKECGFETLKIKKFFYKKKTTKDGFQAICKKCENKRYFQYSNIEEVFINGLHRHIRNKINYKRYKNFPDEQKTNVRCYISKEEFIELWKQHKKDRGYTCHLTGVEIYCKVKKQIRDNSSKNMMGHLNAVSVDRLDPNLGYTKENTIFISNKVNKDKGGVTKELCEAILKVFKEKGL